MNEEKLVDLILDIKTKLSSIETKLDGTAERLSNHEQRLIKLEGLNTSICGEDFKSIVLKYLCKGLLIALSVIATTAGCGSMLKFILSMN